MRNVKLILFYFISIHLCIPSPCNNVRHSRATHTLQYSDPSKSVIKINLISFVDWNWFIFSIIIIIIIFYPKTNLI